MCTVIGEILTSPTATALLSAAIGALLAMGGAYLADARRSRRKDATRFHATRELACSEFLGQVMRAQFSGWPAQPVPKDVAAALWLSKARLQLLSDSALHGTAEAIVRTFETPPSSAPTDQLSQLITTLVERMKASLDIVAKT